MSGTVEEPKIKEAIQNRDDSLTIKAELVLKNHLSRLSGGHEEIICVARRIVPRAFPV
jgi:ABC-type Mn2+/Zn2+ transport system ATPase subunit